MARQHTTVVAAQCTTVDFQLRPFMGCRNVRVIVRNAYTHRTIVGARVTFWVYAEIDPMSHWNMWQQSSDEHGEAGIPQVATGWQLLFAHKNGYKPVAVEVAVFSSPAVQRASLEDEQIIIIELEPEQATTAAKHWNLF